MRGESERGRPEAGVTLIERGFEDDMAGDRSRGSAGRGPASLQGTRGPGGIDSFCITARVVFWKIAGPEGDRWINFE